MMMLLLVVHNSAAPLSFPPNVPVSALSPRTKMARAPSRFVSTWRPSVATFPISRSISIVPRSRRFSPSASPRRLRPIPLRFPLPVLSISRLTLSRSHSLVPSFLIPGVLPTCSTPLLRFLTTSPFTDLEPMLRTSSGPMIRRPSPPRLSSTPTACSTPLPLATTPQCSP